MAQPVKVGKSFSMVQNMPQEFDIVVIGAGPAGSSAACWAARHGARVALVDKASFPRNKLCGGLFTERSHQIFREVFGHEFDFSQAITRREIEFWYKNERLSVLNEVPPLHLTMRIDLDATLFGHAIATGAKDYSGKAIATLTDNLVAFRDGDCIQGRVLIGADGVNSITARHLFGAPFDKRTIGFGLEVEVSETGRPPIDLPLRIDFEAAQWGYGWSFPKKGSTTVGIGGLHASNPDMKDKFSTYLNALGHNGDQKHFKGHFLPFGDFRKVPGRGNILLAGDAAGLIDPITGEGIAHAMKSGQLAAGAAIEALAMNKPESALGYYQASLKDIHQSLRIANRLRRIIFAPRWSQAFTSTFRRSGTVRMQYMRLLAGEIEYPELARKVIKRLPSFLLRRIRG